MKRPPFAVLKLSMVLVLVSFVLAAGGALWSWNQAQDAAAALQQENSDLLRFLAALKARAPGVVRVQGCSLTMQGALAFEALNQPHMQAECELQWFTIMEKAGGVS